MTDNGAGYKNAFKAACDGLDIRHSKTRPYTPKINGKAERVAQTSLREYAYARPYVSSTGRSLAALPTPLQLASTTLSSKPPATHEPHPGCKQPLGIRQLVIAPIGNSTINVAFNV